MRSVGKTTVILMALTAFGWGEARAQTHVSLSLSAGSLFSGVSVGFTQHYDVGTAFAGAAFGTAHPRYTGAYGVYSEPVYYDSRPHYYASGSCWDYYWESYYDPYAGWYDDCVLAGPYRYSYRARSYRARWAGYYRPYSHVRYAYVADPYYDPWGPYW
ncbi:MAG: hypothetical protein KJO65_02505, partial [Gemmatimonadetes bacterium]|nr:hypothetical protein [Gemmatimonadota bacterium]